MCNPKVDTIVSNRARYTNATSVGQNTTKSNRHYLNPSKIVDRNVLLTQSANSSYEYTKENKNKDLLHLEVFLSRHTGYKFQSAN